MFAQRLTQNTAASTKTLQDLVTLECDKILAFIFYKSQPDMPVEQLNQKRNDINGKIKDIMQRSSPQNDSASKQLKKSFDSVKKQLSEVLAALKNQLEQKYNKKVEEVLNQNDITATEHVINDTSSIRVSSTNLISQSIEVRTPPNLLRLGPTTLNKSNTSLAEIKSPTGRFMGMPQHAQSPLQSPVQRSLHADRFKDLQSKEFATGYLHTNQDMTVNQTQLRSMQSDVKIYTEVLDDEVIRGSVQTTEFDDAQRGKALLKKLAPQEHNATGQVVVEVEKVVRDLSMLHKTIQMAKFYRILLGQTGGTAATTQSFDFDSLNTADGEQDQDKVVETYRDMLNDFFKLIVKLNNSVEQLTEKSEIYKLRLLNVDLKQQIQ